MLSMQPKFASFIEINQNLTKTNQNKQIKNKKPNQFIYVQNKNKKSGKIRFEN